jgi:hypothetical protein
MLHAAPAGVGLGQPSSLRDPFTPHTRLGRPRSMLMGCQGCILYSRDAAKGKRPGRKAGSGVRLLVLRMARDWDPDSGVQLLSYSLCTCAGQVYYPHAVNESSPRTSPILVHAWSDRANPSGFFFFHRCVKVLSYQRSFPHVLSSPTPPIAIGIATSERALCP